MTRVTAPLSERLERSVLAPGFAVRRGERWTVLVDEMPTGNQAFAHSVARGLSDSPRWLHCRYLYDAEGSRIFSGITRQPEYYLTRAEAAILEARSDAIREAAGDVPIVELGSGSAEKTRRLIEAWSRAASRDGGGVQYVPIDIDPMVLTRAARALAEEQDDLIVTGLATSYERGLDALRGESPLCLVFLGSSIGNFNPHETDTFLARLDRTLAPSDTLLLGVDLVKEVVAMEAAYDDAAGWSEAFTRNLFRRMNRELGTEVPAESIDHVAYWNDRLDRIEIYARFLEPVEIRLDSIGRRYRVAAGEMILTEIARKYRVERIETDLARFGFRLEERWTDDEGRFAVLLFRRIDEPAGPPAWMRLAAQLQAVRRKTHDLMDALSEADLSRQVLPFLSPIVWDLGHVAEFEELWLIRAIDALEEGHEPVGALEEGYDATKTSREERGAIRYPDLDDLLRRLRRVRHQALERLQTAPLTGHRLREDGFVWRMVAQHEAQHQETVLQAVARMDDVRYEPAYREAPPRPRLPPDAEMVLVPAGPYLLGADRNPAAYDNEKPAHWVDVSGFWIDAAPVTNGEFLGFLEDGGYEREELWSKEGRAWLEGETPRPLAWRREDGGWVEATFGRVEPLVPARPVVHVSWFEAEAFARWAGKRLPTEVEWEKAAAWDAERSIARPWPWGAEPPDAARANLDARTFAPAPVGAYPDGRSFYGCHQMIGDVWEWTASDFAPYPGFEPFPYAEYSAVHFGRGHRVLRGGSWATSALVARTTFRNWDWPSRRQIFAGFRCARDA
ncbi:MAG: ergothioneine biosynthesis protein EgtB [Gemmatimonadetes bacterium]|nr:ergothioneine biosynthesis protein EgtB [Gemmatimonadota bacterium]